MPADVKSILRLEVPLSVQIASRPMRVREISNLAPGAIIELPKLADEQLDVMIGARRIGSGVAVKVGENFGVRVTHVGTMRQRINALAPQPEAESLPQEVAEFSEQVDAADPESTEPESGEQSSEEEEAPEPAAASKDSETADRGNSSEAFDEESPAKAADTGQHPAPESEA